MNSIKMKRFDSRPGMVSYKHVELKWIPCLQPKLRAPWAAFAGCLPSGIAFPGPLATREEMFRRLKPRDFRKARDCQSIAGFSFNKPKPPKAKP